MHAAGLLGERGTNILDGGAPYYDVYRCSDGKYISIAPIETKFFEELCQRLGIAPGTLGEQNDRNAWPQTREVLRQIFSGKTRDHWCQLLEGTDVCFSPVLEASEAPLHPQLKARGTFVEVQGVQQPAPAPRFSRTVPATPKPPEAPSAENQAAALENWLGPKSAKPWIEALDLARLTRH
jgi:crotonobetainyl-CoA:carnitine CoA-transferase CaiB-like acyl-CoA transferase